ncbi:MAG: SdpI family protein [Bacteroidota bacterium]
MEIIILGITGPLFIVLGYYFSKFPPKKINHIYGYRTPRSMKSQEAWNFAQVYGAKKMIVAGWIMLGAGLLLLPFNLTEHLSALLSIGILIGSAIWMIVVTERELKKKFG